MKNKLFYGILLAGLRQKAALFSFQKFAALCRDAATLVVAIMAVAMSVSFTGCSSKIDSNAQTSSVTASNVTLTVEQRQKIQFYTVAPSKFHKTTETTGIG
jgi:hypothetical protein